MVGIWSIGREDWSEREGGMEDERGGRGVEVEAAGGRVRAIACKKPQPC